MGGGGERNRSTTPSSWRLGFNGEMARCTRLSRFSSPQMPVAKLCGTRSTPERKKDDVSQPAHSGRSNVLVSGPPRWLRAWLVCVIAAIAGFALVWFGLPHTNDPIGWIFLAKLAVFIVVTGVVGLFPWHGGRAWLLALVPFLVFAGYLFPRISYFYYVDAERSQADTFYTTMYFLLYPAVILSSAFSYRLAGGSPGRTLKVAWTGIALLFSGFLDVMWQLVNPVEIPATLSPTHIVVIVGRPVTFPEVIWFTVANIPVLVLILVAPIDRWLERLLGPRTPVESAS